MQLNINRLYGGKGRPKQADRLPRQEAVPWWKEKTFDMLSTNWKPKVAYIR
jgi:hypothetical protein